MRFSGAAAMIVLGVLTSMGGFVGIATANTDNWCYFVADKNVGGNWVAGTGHCNTQDCPPSQGGLGACQPRPGGLSSQYPVYNYSFCGCSPTSSSARCELIYFENPSNPLDFFYACPSWTAVCIDVPDTICQLELVSGSTWRCKCK